MTEFDSCPKCGAEPKFGIRCHPKFSMKVGIIDGDNSDLVPVYTHTREQLFAIYRLMGEPEFVDFEQWTGEKWVAFEKEPAPRKRRTLFKLRRRRS